MKKSFSYFYYYWIIAFSIISSLVSLIAKYCYRMFIAHKPAIPGSLYRAEM